ncbi:unnamed protein product [Closterium sp. Yama58-4]|nr:unnamed protein product [Closterium sp. Yama58-4]
MRTNMKFVKGDIQSCIDSESKICQINNAALGSLKLLGDKNYKAIMTVRDPRDVVMLNNVSKSAGINMEVDMITGSTWRNDTQGAYATVLKDFLRVRDSRFTLVRYEDIWYQEQRRIGSAFASIGAWYGLNNSLLLKIFVQSAVKVGQESAAYRSVAKGVLSADDRGKDHFRKGTPGDWKNHLTKQNKGYIREKLGSLLVDLGYEKSMSW